MEEESWTRNPGQEILKEGSSSSWIWIPGFHFFNSFNAFDISHRFFVDSQFFNDFYREFIILLLISWVWIPGFGFLGLASWVWIPGFGVLGLDSWIRSPGLNLLPEVINHIKHMLWSLDLQIMSR